MSRDEGEGQTVEAEHEARERRELDARYRAIFEQNVDAIILADAETERVVHANRAFCELFGWREDELASLHVADYVAEPPETVSANIARALEGESLRRVERRYRQRDGTIVPVELTLTPVESRGRAMVCAIVRDVRERKEAEARQQRLFEDLRAVMDEASDAMFITDPSGRYVDCNAKAEELTGFARAELLSMGIADLVAEESIAARPLDFEALRSLEPVLVERILRTRDGGRVHVEISGRQLRDGRILGLVRDATERRDTEQALRASEEAFRALFETSPVASVITTASGRQIWMANHEAKRLLGVDSRGVESVDLLALFVEPDGHARLTRALEDAGAVNDLEASLRIRDEVRDCVVSARLIPYYGQRVALVSLVDVTDRKRHEASLRQAQKLESLGVLSGGIAHDFNNLLTPVIANLNLAREQLDVAHPTRELVDDVLESAQRAAGLVRQMLTYAGKGQLRVEPHDLGRLVEEMVPLLSVAASKKGRLALGLGARTSKVDVDPMQLRQLVLNLVTNASEAIGERPGSIRLSIRRAELSSADLAALRAGHDLAPGEHVCLEVSDDGAGMSRETLDRIFDPFFTTKEPGRGLGLSASLGIVRGHRAGIAVESEPGRGSTFRVHFRPSSTVRARRAAPAPTRPKLRGRVLLADDDVAVRTSARRLLVHLGLDVVATADGAEAVAAFEADPGFDVVLLDLNMPNMGGLEALERIRARSAHVRCVLCSGYSDRDVAIPQGAPLSFLAKPYTLQDVYQCLAEALAAGDSGATG